MIRYYDNVTAIYGLVLLPVIQNTQEKYKRKKNEHLWNKMLSSGQCK